jgi:hypothetical protein
MRRWPSDVGALTPAVLSSAHSCGVVWELCKYVSSTYIIGLLSWRYFLIALRQTILRALILQRSTITCLLSIVFYHLKETVAAKLFRNF